MMNNEPLRSNIKDKDQLSLLTLIRSWGHCIFFRRIEVWKRKSDVRSSAGTRDQCTFSNSAASSTDDAHHPWLPIHGGFRCSQEGRIPSPCLLTPVFHRQTCICCCLSLSYRAPRCDTSIKLTHITLDGRHGYFYCFRFR